MKFLKKLFQADSKEKQLIKEVLKNRIISIAHLMRANQITFKISSILITKDCTKKAQKAI
jgi:hypothetical protein